MITTSASAAAAAPDAATGIPFAVAAATAAGTTSKPTLHVARTSQTGAATVVLSGIGVGFESAVYTAGIIAAAICGAFLIAGGSVWLALFLIALAGCGLLTTVGVIVAMDTFGPVSDNAQGIAEMSGDVDAEGAQIETFQIPHVAADHEARGRGVVGDHALEVEFEVAIA